MGYKKLYLCGVKLRIYIGIVLMAVMVGCTPPGPLSEGEGASQDSPAAARHPLSEGERLPRPAATPSQRGTTAHEDLENIDSLMWKEPDSALKVMMEFAGSPEADSLNEFEGHYCQVLIAELLFKNDYGQSNRLWGWMGVVRTHAVRPYGNGMRFWRHGRII